MTAPGSRAPVCGVTLAIVLGAAASVASAHAFRPALLTLTERAGGRFDVRWVPPRLGRTPADAVRVRFPARCRRVGGAAGDPGRALDGKRVWTIDCGSAGLRGAVVDVEGLEGLPIDVVVHVRWREGRATTGVLTARTPRLRLPGAGPRGAARRLRAVLRAYLWLGIAHILGGYDHLLFVFGLVMLVPEWRRLLRTVTAFTAAHSLTLALAVLGIVRVPVAPIEALIAASIVFLAAELLRDPAAPPTLGRRHPWFVAGSFGLLHGLGFAGALAAVGLPPGRIPLALGAFNVGVEIGQLLFIVVLLLPLAVARRVPPRIPWVGRLPAYAMGTVAAAWMIERFLAR